MTLSTTILHSSMSHKSNTLNRQSEKRTLLMMYINHVSSNISTSLKLGEQNRIEMAHLSLRLIKKMFHQHVTLNHQSGNNDSSSKFSQFSSFNGRCSNSRMGRFALHPNRAFLIKTVYLNWVLCWKPLEFLSIVFVWNWISICRICIASK